MLIWFLPLFLIFLLIGLPVFFSLLAAPGILLWLNDQGRDAAMLYRNIYNGIDSFPLMAIPFFMLAGELMNRGGITLRLVEFSQAMMGHLRGGLAHVNILTSMLFAGLSGSAVADTSAIGSMLNNAGGSLIDIQFVRGHYDVVVRAEVDNFETLGAIKILVAASGAFDAIETLEIVDMKAITDKVGKLSGTYRAPGN